ncbi:MAG: hypothetical protein A2Z20_06460 [Bdellovibrionales bacterium RBG_16_40_8]|nr:MAG: hypothetical protein A2Z20_06460 [Bdellovibrionales bacterium RBG_16_40_8]
MISDKIILKRASTVDEPLVQSLFERSPSYFKKVDGSDVLHHFAKKEMQDKPKSCLPTYEKVFLLAFLKDKLFGVVDLHKDHPIIGTAYIGLLLVDDEFQEKGIGRSLYFATEKYAINNLNITRFLLGVSELNEVTGFWEKVGFSNNGKSYI